MSTSGPQVPGAQAPGSPTGLGSPLHLYVPGDTAARAVGADAVAECAEAQGARVTRTGSRGALWLEPLVEVLGADGLRYGFGPVRPGEVPALLEVLARSGAIEATAAIGPAAIGPAAIGPVAIGPVDQHPWIARQNRLITARLGVIDPTSPQDYVAHGGMVGLRAALAMSPADVVERVVDSGLRGRGGAGFPTGIKWRTVAAGASQGLATVIVCNVDEGDSGTFADRMVLEGDPFALIEGLLITAHAVGAAEAYVYIRSEYPAAFSAFERALSSAREQRWLTPDGPYGLALGVHLRSGAGAYICGEETSLLESLEGRRPVVRAKPPVPAVSGLFGRPTVVNNLLTLVSLPGIFAEPEGAYANRGTARSRGTQVMQLAGNIARGGLVELDFGLSLRELIDEWGGGTATGRPIGAVQVGGPLGAYLGPDDLDLPLDYEAFAAVGAMLGHGGVVVFDDRFDPLAQARFAMHFCAEESCGKCTPCRIGAVRGVEVIDRIGVSLRSDLALRSDQALRSDLALRSELTLLEDLCTVMASGSLCAMGQLTPAPVRSALRMALARSGTPSGVANAESTSQEAP